ncbi:MAG: FkbM family methyltransferase [Candidatus Thiodiazotropha sp. (ex Lucinoma borealis)]|nr:FkbM family methyltransferase [Candidatus Thiodiazotropha sp. (ex Troendleina suluensis)]MCU7866545.1 FkbM family methyltransferase [Candidatus Thiodiazotropha sp. (ex Lucinoma borealis)]MCU7946755.1 FkbM family methyltransferase [Candidatus Thiodiazotropha sp. (ex Cardiolucina cf. quadrata)]
MNNVDLEKCYLRAKEFCHQFTKSQSRPRFVFGTNEFAKSIARTIDIDGFVNDYSNDKTYLGKPICNTENIPIDALVVSSVVLGRPLTVSKKLDELGIDNLDYFLFRLFSGLEIIPVTMWDEFNHDYIQNEEKYNWLRTILEDNDSKLIFDHLISFRKTGCLEYMRGFTDCQQRQYFEEFLHLPNENQTFIDVGAYDGYTSLEFIRRYPDYKSIHIFEPEASNLEKAKYKLEHFKNINYYLLGLSNNTGTLRFSVSGASSSITSVGECHISVDKLDNIISESVHFIKMDIEGAESAALEGAKSTIINSHPVLAICVYHKGDDFWSIPEQILSYRDDYSVFMRHYTEGVTETVMFFVPK